MIGTALRERDEGEASVVVTMAGSASEELWKRLCRLGYLESVRTADLPETLRFVNQTRAFALTDVAHEATRLPLLLASWSATAEAGLTPDDVRPVVDAICGLPLPPARALEGLRADLADPAGRFRQDEGSAVLQFLGTDLLSEAGLIERDDANEWRPATLTPLVAPFVLDGYRAACRWVGTPGVSAATSARREPRR